MEGIVPKKRKEHSNVPVDVLRRLVSAKVKGLTNDESKVCNYALAQDDDVVMAEKFGLIIRVKDLRRLEPGG